MPAQFVKERLNDPAHYLIAPSTIRVEGDRQVWVFCISARLGGRANNKNTHATAARKKKKGKEGGLLSEIPVHHGSIYSQISGARAGGFFLRGGGGADPQCMHNSGGFYCMRHIRARSPFGYGTGYYGEIYCSAIEHICSAPSMHLDCTWKVICQAFVSPLHAIACDFMFVWAVLSWEVSCGVC